MASEADVMSNALIELPPGGTAVVGYGCLLSFAHAQRLFDGAYDGPFVRAAVSGWRRDWSVAVPNRSVYFRIGTARVYPERIHYLNAVPAPGSVMNCSVLVMDREHRRQLHDSGRIYDAVDVRARLLGVTVVGGPVLMYVGRPAYVRPFGVSASASAVRRTYVDMIEQALRSLSTQEKDAFQRTTDVPPASCIIDDVFDAQQQEATAAGIRVPAGRWHPVP